MKKSFYFFACCLIIVSMTFISCSDNDEFTIENKAVSGDLVFIRTAFIPLSFDSTGMIPLSAQISMEGDGTVSDIGDVHFETTFKIDLILGMGYDFLTTYTGSSLGDSFSSTGTSQAQPNGSFLVVDEFSAGTGKFSKISGEGFTTVWLNQAQDEGTATMEWTVTY
ncbi:MAG: hypothetical protein M3R25_10840 [Bacteroidota bacterium]|nr:hypothetical protein [Bacteroidota bacterium]